MNFTNVLRNKLRKHENTHAGCSLSVRVGVYWFGASGPDPCSSGCWLLLNLAKGSVLVSFSAAVLKFSDEHDLREKVFI